MLLESSQGVKQPAPLSESDLSPDAAESSVCGDAGGESPLLPREEGPHVWLAPGVSKSRSVLSGQVSEQGWQFSFVPTHLGSKRAHLSWESGPFLRGCRMQRAFKEESNWSWQDLPSNQRSQGTGTLSPPTLLGAVTCHVFGIWHLPRERKPEERSCLVWMGSSAWPSCATVPILGEALQGTALSSHLDVDLWVFPVSHLWQTGSTPSHLWLRTSNRTLLMSRCFARGVETS